MNKKYVLLVALVGVGIIIMLVLSLRSGRKEPQTTAPELDSPGTVVIDNTSPLRDLLLQKQYIIVTDALVDYIQNNIGSEIEHASIQGKPQIASNGDITFLVYITENKKEFEVQIDRTQFDQVIFKVPSTNYSRTLTTYGSN